MNIGELTATLGVDDSALLKSTQSFKKYGEEAQKVITKVNGVTRQHTGIIEGIEKQLDKLQTSQKKVWKYDDLVKYNKKIAETREELKQAQTAGMKAMNTTPAQNMSKALMTVGMRALGAVASFTALKKGAELLLHSSDILSDRWERYFAGMKGSLSVLGQEFINIADKASKGMDEGDKSTRHWYTSVLAFAGAVIKSGGNVTQAATQYNYMREMMEDASKAAIEYKTAMDELFKAETALIVPRAISNKLLMEARSKGRDETLSIRQRIAMVKEAIAIEREETAKAKENQDIKVSALTALKQSYIDTGRISQWTKEMERDYQLEIAKTYQLQSESYSKTRFNESELRTLMAEKLKQEQAYGLALEYNFQTIQLSQSTQIKTLKDTIKPMDAVTAKIIQTAQNNEALKISFQDMTNTAIQVGQAMNQVFSNWMDYTSIQRDNQLKSVEAYAQRAGKSEEWLSKERERINKEYLKKYKIWATTQAIINTALAVTNALANTKNPILMWIQAGLVTAAGAIEIATINAQQFAKGGVVPPGYPNDSYPARLTSGETVTPPGQLPDFNGGISEEMFGKYMKEQTNDIVHGIMNQPRPIYEGMNMIGIQQGLNKIMLRNKKNKHARRS
jgi:hypothetical protein